MKKSKRSGDWGARLQSVLKEKGISIRKAAAIAGVSPSVVDSWTGGASPKDFGAVKRLADELGASFSWLLTGERELQHEAPPITELFTETPYFDGYARVRIDRLTPKKPEASDD